MIHAITDPVELFWFDFSTGYWEHMDANINTVMSLFGG